MTISDIWFASVCTILVLTVVALAIATIIKMFER